MIGRKLGKRPGHPGIRAGCSRAERPGARLSTLGLALIAGAWLACGDSIERAPDERPLSVVLITLDTTRVDHLSCYGYERETTPKLDAFAARAVRFRHAWSTSSWTLPAHASLFSGLYPSRHGAHYDQTGDAVLGSVVKLPAAALVKAGKLPDKVSTLAEMLAARGYRTGAFVAGPWLHRSFGLLQGFELKDDRVAGFAGRPADEITRNAVAWLRELEPSEPYLLFVNYFDAHAPYEPARSYADLPRAAEPFAPPYADLMRGKVRLNPDESAILRDRYDAEIRVMDSELGRLLDEVMARPGAERTIVVITADHGEALGEEGRFGHGFWLSEELIRVPLIVRHPHDRDGGSWNEAPVQLVDVLPMLASELGMTPPEGVEGVAIGQRQVAYAELYQEATTVARFGEQYAGNLRVAIDWPHKLLRTEAGSDNLHLLSPQSLSERVVSDAGRASALARQLDRHAESGPTGATVAPEVDPHMLDALRELGYVD